MGLGVKFSDGPGGGLAVVTVEKGGSVADAGGLIGDLWLTIDGQPAAEVLAEWHDGTRQHRPGVPLTVAVRTSD
jgi:S1-C subfamily serine protease